MHFTPFHPVDPSSTNGPNGLATSVDSQTTESHPPIPAVEPITCMVYIGLPTNPQFLRDPAERDPEAVARVISVSKGESGRNTEYLYLLEKALEGLGLGSSDGHVTELVKRVKRIERERNHMEAAQREESEAAENVRKSLEESFS